MHIHLKLILMIKSNEQLVFAFLQLLLTVDLAEMMLNLDEICVNCDFKFNWSDTWSLG